MTAPYNSRRPMSPLEKVTSLRRIAILTAILLPLLLAGFLFLTVKNSKGCSQLVIDTYELHSGIDIPEVESVSCHYDETKAVRLAVYSFREGAAVYLDPRRFEPTRAAGESVLRGFDLLSAEEVPRDGEFLLAQGTRWGREWRYLVDRRTGKLWAEISYQ